MKLSIIVPAYNEQTTIAEIVHYLQAVNYPIDHEIIIVDDASIDRTYEKSIFLKREARREDNNVRLFKNRINRGKGFSIRKGIKRAQGDVIVIQDADIEYDPHDIPKLLRPILEGKAAVVYGSRFSYARRPQGMAYPNWVANKILTKLTNLLYGLHITDEASGYKMFKADVLKSLNLQADRFDFCPEVTAMVARKRIPILEIPIHYQGRATKDGKKIRARDFVSAVFTLIRCLFVPLD